MLMKTAILQVFSKNYADKQKTGVTNNMSANIIDGKAIAAKIKEEAAEVALKLKEQGIMPCLAVVLVGDNSASKVYVNNKKKACEAVGIHSVSYEMPEDLSEEELLKLIDTLNKDEKVHGILVQLPLPKHIDETKVIMAISPSKDVDCFHPQNVGALHTGGQGFLPCTPAGIIELILRSGYSISGKRCVVIGRSNIVGKPVAMLLLRENGTVTICHSKTKDLYEVCKQADIIVVATGKINTLTKDMVKEGAIVIDVGMNRDENGKLCGDVDFAEVSQVAGAITPVPGGVGPMTIAMLMKNCLTAVTIQKNLK
jgi:methylenetetrahydrofolate dehydrogenase (NADP+)/methenyltetrahydrofolate cyclohydrolase